MTNPIKESSDAQAEDEANENTEIAVKKMAAQILELLVDRGIVGELAPFALAHCAGIAVRIVSEATGRDLIHGTVLANQTLAAAAGVDVECSIEFCGRLN